MALTNGKIRALSWTGLVEDGFAYAVRKGKISPAQGDAWKPQLNSSDLDDLLSAAEFMARKLGAPNGDLYARWLESVFGHVKAENTQMESAIRALHTAGIPLCTLNYDSLLEKTTGLTSINFGEPLKVGAWMRRETQGVLHLHGSWEAPFTCILGIRDYETTLSDELRDLIQRTLSSFSRLLFIGCGDTFGDPNFSALIKWLREKMKTAAPQHYALVRADEVAKRHADPTWQGFVDPISYGQNQNDLSGFLLKKFPAMAVARTKEKVSPAKISSATAKHANVLEDYRTFLLKDCGQMTIEGVRADMDTAQRRFDLERLFVPAKVLPVPPEIPASDPEREQKLLQWQEKHREPVPFSKVFKKHKRLALLALPGGGKTLLLKRLAVAYADPTRRGSSEDGLPDLPLTPVLIRCREWKEYIKRPILALLQNIAAITGQTSLADLNEALVPLLKKGRVLLLIDGLDEIHNDADRTTFVEHLEAFLTEYKLIHLVVTSREAGFSLVAPCLTRFCQRWRLAPLEEDAIGALCDHWHRLMTGASPEALAEGRDVAQRILGNESLRRLAENPLLLTMLLVVKHGAGRLPPDRVSLYDRAVEVLLDTWNIKGHDALNLKEAVPQLACVAFQLIREGRQKATAKELLAILDEAREKVPQIRRYAKDTPDEFLRRVELRSSLLVEAGHQMEGTRTVPFYQFRHLTFQEYLAAVAAVEGHYMEYQKGETVLTALRPYLTAEEWKEVVPMAAVLARKQAEPLIGALVAEGDSLRKMMEGGEDFSGKEEWMANRQLPSAVARLVQCLAEEAEASPETLTAALQLIALFAKGCTSQDNWQALGLGPYGEELLHQAWLLYAPMQWVSESWLRNTLAVLLTYRRPDTYWRSNEAQADLLRLLRSESAEEIARGLLIIGGLHWRSPRRVELVSLPLADIERHLFHEDPALWHAAMWAWALTRKYHGAPEPSPLVLDRLLSLWLIGAEQKVPGIVAFAFSTVVGLPRSIWTPVLTEEQKHFVRQAANASDEKTDANLKDEPFASLVVAFHARDLWPDEELAERLVAAPRTTFGVTEEAVDQLLKQMGKAGQKFLRLREEERRTRK